MATLWNLDPAHSEVHFKVKHMMIATVTGSFQTFEATVEAEGDDFSQAKVRFTAQTDSISTGNAQRDGHLKSPDFFDAEKNPHIQFVSTSFTKKGSDYEMTGELSIAGKTNSITLQVEFGGIQKDPWGNTKAGFTVTGKLSRKAWGLTWNAALETGGVLVSDEVKISCEVQFAKA